MALIDFSSLRHSFPSAVVLKFLFRRWIWFVRCRFTFVSGLFRCAGERNGGGWTDSIEECSESHSHPSTHNVLLIYDGKNEMCVGVVGGWNNEEATTNLIRHRRGKSFFETFRFGAVVCLLWWTYFHTTDKKSTQSTCIDLIHRRDNNYFLFHP